MQRIDGYSDDPEAFRRNFERDKELLRQMGLPLATEPLDPAHPEELGYRIPREEYELPDPGLDEDELAALRLASAAVQLDGAWGRNATVRAPAEAGRRRDRRQGGPGPAVSGEGAPGPPPAWPPCRAAIWSRRRSGPSPTAAGSGSPTGRRTGWWTPGGCRSGAASGTWPASTTAAARSACSASTAWPARCRSRDRPAPSPGHRRLRRSPPPPWRLGDDEEIVAELLVDAEQARWALEALGAEAVTSPAPRRRPGVLGGGDQRACLPVLRPGLPRPRRDPGAAGPAHRHGRVAGRPRRPGRPQGRQCGRSRG